MRDEPQTVLHSSPACAANEPYPWLDADAGQPPFAPEVTALGQSVTLRLLSAGLDLNVALTQAHDEAETQRLRRAVRELDAAVRELRRLVLAVPGTPAAPPPRSPGPHG